MKSVAVGVCIGALLVAALAWFTGTGPIGRPGVDDEVRARAGDIDVLAAECESVDDIDESPDCRYVSVAASIEQFWTEEFARRGASYEPAVTTLFSGSVRTACGAASDQVGPFYCPADKGVYLDLDFFYAFRAQEPGSGSFGVAYMLAHQYGHHVQNLTGQMWGLRRGSGPDSDALRLELQADCYAGVWTHHATRPPMSEHALISEPSSRDVADGLAAAETVGDEYIEESFHGTIAPELWSHGSSEQRLRWFEVGYADGALEDCNTFGAEAIL